MFLFVTANAHEKDAFKRCFRQNSKGFVKGKEYLIGEFGKYNVAYIHMDEQGVTNPASTPLVGELIRKLNPEAVIMVGIAFGSDSSKQRIGDVLISKTILPYDAQKLLEDSDHNELTNYKEQPKEVGFQLHNAFYNSDDWKYMLDETSFSRVFDGAILTGSRLINNYKYRTKLLHDFQEYEPIGGEMEAFGIYSMCRLHGVGEWIVIKGICDWGFNKGISEKDEYQKIAARAAVSYCEYVFDQDEVFNDLLKKNDTTEVTKENSSLAEVIAPLALPIVPAPWISIDDQHATAHSRVSDSAIPRFLQGERCSWGLVYNNKIVRRDVVDTLKTHALDGGITLFLGAGGEGKSTALMQMCAELSKEGHVIKYHDPEVLHFPIDCWVQDTVFIVDNPPNNLSFAKFYYWICQNERALIIGSRGNEWNIIERDQTLPKRVQRKVTMPKITKEEAEIFADLMLVSIDGMSRNRSEIIQLLLKDSYGYLYASFLLITHNAENLDEIAKNILERLIINTPAVLKLLAHIVLAEHIEVAFSNILHRKVRETYQLTRGESEGFLKLEVEQSGLNFQTRHKTISDLFYRYLFEEDILDLILTSKRSEMENLGRNFVDTIYTEGLNNFTSLFFENKDRLKTNELLLNISKLLSSIDISNVNLQDHMAMIVIDYFKSFHNYLFFIIKNTSNESALFSLLRHCFARDVYDRNILLLFADSSLALGLDKGEVFSKILSLDGLNVDLWIAWARFAIEQNNLGDFFSPAKFSARWIFRAKSAAKEVLSNVAIWLEWAQFEINQKEIGSFFHPAESTARWIFREVYTNHQDAFNNRIMQDWVKLEIQQGNLGKFDTPRKYTARWIFRDAYKSHSDIFNDQLWLEWTNIEIEQNQIGNFDSPHKHSARWIFRKVCTSRINCEPLWQAWAQFEIEQKEFGDFEEPLKYSARWIFREFYINKGNIKGSRIWIAWARFEAWKKEVSNFNNPKQFSMRWIFRESMLNDKTYDEHLWLSWARYEITQNEFGDFDNPKPFSARWIFREFYKNRGDINGETIWFAWTRFEAEQNEISDFDNPKQFSLRWIFREFLSNNTCNEHLWLAWAQYEITQNEFGDFDNPKPFSARWIFREFCKNRANINAVQVWIAWARFEAEQKEVSDFDNPKQFSARWIFRELLSNNTCNEISWFSWAQHEITQNEFGDFHNPKPFSARWIFREFFRNSGNISGVQAWLLWARFEAEQKEVSDFENPKQFSVRWIYREFKLNQKAFNDASIWLAWAQYEISQNEFGDFDNPRQFSARWVFREAACHETIRNFPIFIAWACFEAKQNSFKDFDNPIKYSARWIFREFCINRKIHGEPLWLAWAKFEEEQKEFGGFCNPQLYTARWVFREFYFIRKNAISTNFGLIWAVFEFEQEKVNDFVNQQMYSSMWIFQNICYKRNRLSLSDSLGEAWLQLESEFADYKGTC